jgi:GNAT superfamily N-acetyltransferase
MQDPHITPASVADAAAVNALQRQLGYSVAIPDTADRLSALAATGRDPVFVLRRAGEVLGLMALHHAPSLNYPGGIARIMAIVVAEQARGQGLGGRLVAHATGWARDIGCEALELTSRLDRVDAHRFYRRLGFTETSLRFRVRL